MRLIFYRSRNGFPDQTGNDPILLSHRHVHQLFKDLGTDTTTAIRMFLTQAVANNGFPFEIKRIVRSPYSPMTEEEILEKLEKSRESAAKGNHKSAEVVVSELRGKYGL